MADKARIVAGVLGIVLAVGLVAWPAAVAIAFVYTGCSWGPYGSTVTWKNSAPAGDYYNSGIDAGYSWAANTDINSMAPTQGAIVGYLDDRGYNGYDGFTMWTCNGNATLNANVTLNPTYMNSLSDQQKRIVWLHELAHALGLSHSGTETAMYYCPRCVGFPDPQGDDINGINSLY